MRIGIIGAGMIGSTVGKLWIDAGHEVRFASRHPEELQSLVKKLGKRASAGTPAEAAAFGEVVMITVLESGARSAGWAEEKFPKARWVKGFNTVYFKALEKEAHRDGDRVGIPLAGDDPVAVGPLPRGRDFEPGTRVYNTGMGGQQLRKSLA